MVEELLVVPMSDSLPKVCLLTFACLFACLYVLIHVKQEVMPADGAQPSFTLAGTNRDGGGSSPNGTSTGMWWVGEWRTGKLRNLVKFEITKLSRPRERVRPISAMEMLL